MQFARSYVCILSDMLQSIDCFINSDMSTQFIRVRMVIVTDCFAGLFAVSGVNTPRLNAGIQALNIIKASVDLHILLKILFRETCAVFVGFNSCICMSG